MDRQTNEMRYIFTCSTSYGKSTFINAFLRRKILPSGIGCTTAQLIKIKGSPNNKYMIKIQRGEPSQVSKGLILC